ncbi:dihydrodipicolinate synthase [Segniliparus rotundus DSM 44985]|uniref:4-hydroxy-tetrahydrodipicolinate synthase n=1 Tax=Segniliparus rotundus (strain ATCC BAA-972 / CDC 1076 / CIP 108378 / DSM 44985 / JCM 13578) TaxID=640132 RepID=D6Z916_SEGRD|nr:4-hydroxy-tetrahydrodipicolinate synthase [Segniliparus rotundus]ADG98446.1 dihydrodipicolinate synthase [Segniliparus rotundus DSM 44985]
MTQSAAEPLFGTVAVAMVTPFSADGSLDVRAGVALAERLVARGVDGLVLGGTTGESPTTSPAEKLELLSAVLAAVGDRAKITQGVGSYDTAKSVQAARDAQAAGAHGLLVVTPYYSKPSQAGLAAHCRAVADAVTTPIMLYDVPHRTALAIEPATLQELAAHPNIAAMKEAKGDFGSGAELIATTGLQYYSGDDVVYLPWLAVGAVGVVSVLGHLVPEQLRELHTAFAEGDLARARELQVSILPLVRAQARYGGVALAKAGLALLGQPVGEPRLPILGLDGEETAALAQDLELVGARQ